ncbi:7SK snRNA methylphosphate capping enzyme [Hoplias malabaricus]|uniref:7SK snRNA methylphosphate capping enzyme n=1 Tax=Hoplias malabaricus TaxID=27720 RepID=UPI003462A6BE
MIEMSVEKETVLVESGAGGVLSPAHNPMGRPKTPSPPGTTLPLSIGASSMVLPPNSTLPELEGDISEALHARADSKPFPLKNGLQAQAGAQKLSKRRYSVSAGFKHPGFSKRRRRANSDCEPVLPTNFLLGGNIFDPLNLNSLLDDEVNKALNAETPKSSPLPAKSREPVEILIPKDITDPLNLSGRGGGALDCVLVSPMKSGGRRRHRNRHHGGPNGSQIDPDSKAPLDDVSRSLFSAPEVSAVPEVSREPAVMHDLQTVQESPQPYELNTSINCRDEVVPPILPRRRSNASRSNSAPLAQTSSSSSSNLSKNRRRRRTVSRSERLSITPTPSTSAERGRSQTFHTPIASGSHRAGPRQTVQHRPKPQRKFHYGTYSRFYGYQTPMVSRDPRLALLRPEWFRAKKVLDVGCNVGHMTLTIAKHWSPAHILGLDIDSRLVHAARQNLRHFLSELQRQEVSRGSSDLNRARRQREDKLKEEDKLDRSREKGQKRDDDSKAMDAETEGGAVERDVGQKPELMPLMNLQLEPFRPFPVSFRVCRGPISAPPLHPRTPGVFPNNVSFMTGNYVPESEVAVMSQRAEYDVILCLSVTKWVQLNWGDAGLQRFFRRLYRHLTPGGVLILEPQPWSSYSKRKRLTETTFRNYNTIRLRPDQFSSYLTSEVGFSSYELLGSRTSVPAGLQRPIYLFHKGPASSRK